MELRLKTLNVLSKFCDYKDAKYDPPKDLLVLGSPDMPIEPLVVMSGAGTKWTFWTYPYQKLANRAGQRGELLYCEGENKSK